MTVTVENLEDLINQVNQQADIVLPKIEDLEGRLLALQGDPGQPNAEGTLNTYIIERSDIATEWNSGGLLDYNTLKQLYNDASPSVKQQIATQFQALQAKLVSLTTKGVTQRDTTIPNTRDAVENAAQQKQEEEEQNGGGGDQNGSDDDSGGETPVTPTPGFTPRTPTPEETPGRRPKNPLGYFSSYTYQISLYMLTGKARDAFLDSGRRNIFALPEGVVLIAQSGGINKENRSPDLPYDFYIDNLRMKSACNPKATQSGVALTEAINFNIVEPYGFNFPTSLKKAMDNLHARSTSTSDKSQTNPTRQFFCLGIRFLGYDENGKVMNGNTSYQGNVLDANWSANTSQGLFERYFDITIVQINWKIDGKVTNYQIECQDTSEYGALSLKRGFLNTNAKFEGGTVEEVLNSFMNKLNADQEDLKKSEPQKIKEKNNFSINWNAQGADLLKKSSMLTPEDTDKSKSGTDPAQSTKGASDAQAVRATPDNTKKLLQYKNDNPIVQIIQHVISQSAYIRDGLKIVYESQVEPQGPGEVQSENQNFPKTKRQTRWVNISVECRNPRWDSLTQDYAYDIIFIIQPYDTPAAPSANMANKGTTPPAFKEYNYWYTGKNSEIISFDLSLNNNHMNIIFDPSVNNGQGSQGQAKVPQVGNRANNVDKTGGLDKKNQAAGEYLTAVSDPESLSQIKLTILGDPDYLIQTQESPVGLGNSNRKYYGTDGYTINPNSSQFFIDLNFYEGIDYDTGTGLMKINDKILFYLTPPESNFQGVRLMPIDIQHTFNNGKFTQVIYATFDTSVTSNPTPSTN